MRVPQNTFTAGEVSPELYARVDLQLYDAGLGACRNFYPMAYGGVTRRPGTEFIAEVYDSEKDSAFIGFVFNAEQTYALEFGDGVMRILTDGGLVVHTTETTDAWASGTDYELHTSVNDGVNVYRCIAPHTATTDDEPGAGVNWETYWLLDSVVHIVSPYAAEDVFQLRWAQSADVLYLVCPGYDPRRLTRTAHYAWTFTVLTFELDIAVPANLAATPTNFADNDDTIEYKVSAVVGGIEGEPSEAVSVTTDVGWPADGKVTLTWDAVTDAEEYRVYKNANGMFGYIGSTEADSTTFKDNYIDPDYTDTPKSEFDPFDDDEYPETIALHEQRLWFACTNLRPQSFFASNSGEFEIWSQSFPLKTDDAFTYTVADGQVNKIMWFAALDDLLMGTSAKERKVIPLSESTALGPGNITMRVQTMYGSNSLAPLTVGESILHCSRENSLIRDLGYQLAKDGYTGNDLTVKSRHLFDHFDLIRWGYAQAPHSIIWAVRSDGVVLSMTYMKEHEVFGWAWHDTKGAFKEVCAVPGDGKTDVYFIVERTINGETKRFIERLATGIGVTGTSQNGKAELDNTELWYSDCSMKYEDAAATVISGLDHLEGESVHVVADGNVVDGLTVSGGEITLPTASEKVIVGLPIENAYIDTLPVDVQDTSGNAITRIKSIPSVTVRVNNSRGFWAGALDENDEVNLYEQPVRTDEDYGEPIALTFTDYEMALEAVSGRSGRVRISQPDPIPLTILAVVPEVVLEDARDGY